MATRYHLRFPEPALARGDDPNLAFRSSGADGLAEELQDALRSPALYERWLALQEDPENVDPEMGAIDPTAVVIGEDSDLKVRLEVTTTIPGGVFKHRLHLLAGSNWELRDVTSA